MTARQWEALLAASHGNLERFHGATRWSLRRRGLVEFIPGEGLRLTQRGLQRLKDRYAPGEIGEVRAGREGAK